MSHHIIIIGAGPVGLIAAYQWILRGRQVTIYDARLPSEATRPQIVLVAKENWALVPPAVQERLKINGGCVIADDTRVVCTNDPSINRARGQRGGRGSRESGPTNESGWKGGTSVSLNTLQSELYNYLIHRYPRQFHFVNRAFTRWSDIDNTIAEFVLIADGGGRESIIHQIPELRNTTPSQQPLGYGGAVTFDLNVPNLQQYLVEPTVQQWLKSQQIVLLLRTLSNHMYVALQIGEKSGQLLSTISDAQTKWHTFRSQTVEGKVYAQLLERLPVLDVRNVTPQLSIFPIRLRSLLQFTTVTPLRRTPVLVLGDAGFNVHFFTASGLNNGLVEMLYLLDMDGSGPVTNWLVPYNAFVTKLRHETWVQKTPNVYVDIDQLVRNCARGNPAELVDCIVETARVGPNEERKTSARMNTYIASLGHNPKINSFRQISSPPVLQQNLFRSMTSIAEKKDTLYRYLADEWLNAKSGRPSIFNSPSGFRSEPPVDPDNQYEYKNFLDLSAALSDDGIILAIEPSTNGKSRQIVIDATKLNQIVPTVLTKFGYMNQAMPPFSHLPDVPPPPPPVPPPPPYPMAGRVRFGPAQPPQPRSGGPNPVNRVLQPSVPVRAEDVLPDVIPPMPKEAKANGPRFTDDGYDFLLGPVIPAGPIIGNEFVLDARTFDIIHFWARQMQEHANIIYLKVEDPQLKARAQDLWKRWERLYVAIFGPTKIEPDKIFLTQGDWEKYERASNRFPPQDVHNGILMGITLLGQLKKDILDQVTNGVWVGDLTPMYLAHLLRELKHFRRDLIEGPNMPAKDRIQFWDITSGEHAALAGRELDPKLRNKADKKQGNNFYKEFLTQIQRTSDAKTTVSEADAASTKKITELRDWTLRAEQGLKDHTLMGTLHPQLQVEHDRREADRALYELDQLKKKSQLLGAVAMPSGPRPRPRPRPMPQNARPPISRAISGASLISGSGAGAVDLPE